MQPKLLPAGDRGLLIELGDVSTARLHAAAAAVGAIGGALVCIAGQESLYVVFDRQPAHDAVRNALVHAGELHVEPRFHTIEVSFAREDAPDLPEFLGRVGLDRHAFFDRVRALRLSARYLGFRAGFAYLDGWPGEWRMDRRPTSRPRVPRGSFAIAGPSAGFYPIDSPGGWNILGRTAAPLWDARRNPPNMIAAGDEITIVPVERLGNLPAIEEAMPAERIDGMEILVNGQFANVAGAPQWSRIQFGLPPGGRFDEGAAVAANRVAGDGDDAPVLECAMLVPRLRFSTERVVVWCGADCDLPPLQPIRVKAGEEIGGMRIRGGLRGWLAVGEPHDRRHSEPAEPRSGEARRRISQLQTPDMSVIRCIAGPHETPLREIACEVTPQLNRIGIRMRPIDPIAFEVPAGLPSCGMQFGTIQLHPDGTIVAMGPDHPITGGYLQPMTVMWDERRKLAQLAPGDKVRFVC